MILLALAARMLGPEGFGPLAVIMAGAGLAYGLGSVPGNEVIIAYVMRDLTARRPYAAAGTVRFAFLLSLVLALLIYLALVSVMLVLSERFESVEAYRPAVILYGLVGLSGSTTRESLALLRLADRLGLGVAAAAAGAVTKASAMGAAWMADGGLLSVVAAYVAGDAVTGIGLFIAAAASERRAGLPGFRRSLRVRIPGRDVIGFQVASCVRTSVEAVTLHMDAILLASLVSGAQLGLYRAAILIINATAHPFRSISLAVQSEYSRQWHAGDVEASRGICIRFTVVALALALVGYVVLGIWHRPIIRAVLGAGFEEAANPLLFLFPGALASAAVASLRVLPAAAGRAAPGLIASLSALAAQVLGIALLAPTYGAEGAAWANTVHGLVFAAVITPFAVATLRQNEWSPDSALDRDNRNE